MEALDLTLVGEQLALKPAERAGQAFRIASGEGAEEVTPRSGRREVEIAGLIEERIEGLQAPRYRRGIAAR
jgi:hypothetical protein